MKEGDRSPSKQETRKEVPPYFDETKGRWVSGNKGRTRKEAQELDARREVTNYDDAYTIARKKGRKITTRKIPE